MSPPKDRLNKRMWLIMSSQTDKIKYRNAIGINLKCIETSYTSRNTLSTRRKHCSANKIFYLASLRPLISRLLRSSYLVRLNGNLDGLPGLQQNTVCTIGPDDDLELLHLILQQFRLSRILAPLGKTFPRRKQFCGLQNKARNSD